MDKDELREAYYRLFKDGTEDEFEAIYKVIIANSEKYL